METSFQIWNGDGRGAVSQPADKVLTVLGFLSSRADQPLSLAAIAAATAVPKATLLRILGSLGKFGYAYRLADKRYQANVQVIPRIQGSQEYIDRLRAELRLIASRSGQCAEAITVDREELVWFDRIEHPGLAITIKAYPGFRRTLLELDAPSRVWLRHLGRDRVQSLFRSAAFFSTGQAKEPMPFERVLKLVSRPESGSGVAFDTEGNANGVRRFASVIHPPGGQACIVCIAEPAIARPNPREYNNRMVSILVESINRLKGASQ